MSLTLNISVSHPASPTVWREVMTSMTSKHSEIHRTTPSYSLEVTKSIGDLTSSIWRQVPPRSPLGFSIFVGKPKGDLEGTQLQMAQLRAESIYMNSRQFSEVPLGVSGKSEVVEVMTSIVAGSGYANSGVCGLYGSVRPSLTSTRGQIPGEDQNGLGGCTGPSTWKIFHKNSSEIHTNNPMFISLVIH